MSGPKSGTYELAEWRRRQLEEKRRQQLEEQKCNKIKKEITALTKELKALAKEMDGSEDVKRSISVEARISSITEKPWGENSQELAQQREEVKEVRNQIKQELDAERKVQSMEKLLDEEKQQLKTKEPEAYSLTRVEKDSEKEREDLQEMQNLKDTFLSIQSLRNKKLSASEEKNEWQEVEKMDSQTLRQLVQDSEKEWEEQETAAYIAEMVDSVMKDMGYDLVATDQINTPKRTVDHRLFDFGQDTLINAYASSNGHLMFEVSGITKEDVPSRQEKLRTKEAMERFCPLYDKLKEKLAEKGILVQQETRMPIDDTFVKTTPGKSLPKRKNRRMHGLKEGSNGVYKGL